ncbi:MAG: VWA domain-containing protein, partial [Acidobacteria bacterium]|nr:VWA domain-containing protein [Acidobacteriota bacterium]
AYPVDARGLLTREPERDEYDVAATNRIFRDPSSAAPSQTSQPIGIETMQRIAEATGGQAFVNTNDLTGAIRTIIEDSAVGYSLGFYVAPSSLDGKFHPVKVEVKRPGVTVVAQKGYFAFKDDPATMGERQASFIAAIRSPLDSSAIPLEIKVDRLPPPQNSWQIVAAFGIRGLRLTESPDARSGVVDVYVIEQDAAGNVLRQAANRMHLKLTEQQYRRYLETGIGFRQLIHPNPGATTVRVIVQDRNTSQLGSAIIPLAEVR